MSESMSMAMSRSPSPSRSSTPAPRHVDVALDAEVSREASVMNPPATQQMNDVIQNVKFTGICLPIILHSSAASDVKAHSTYQLDAARFLADYLDPAFGSMQFQPAASIFHASLFVPIQCLDTTVPFWRFKYEDEGTSTVDNFRILYTVFTYTVALLSRSRSKSGAFLQNPVEVAIEMLPAPGFEGDDWEQFGAEALLGYHIHAFVQVGDPLREIAVLDPEAVPDFEQSDDEKGDDEDDVDADMQDPDDDPEIRALQSQLDLLKDAYDELVSAPPEEVEEEDEPEEDEEEEEEEDEPEEEEEQEDEPEEEEEETDEDNDDDLDDDDLDDREREETRRLRAARRKREARERKREAREREAQQKREARERKREARERDAQQKREARERVAQRKREALERAAQRKREARARAAQRKSDVAQLQRDIRDVTKELKDRRKQIDDRNKELRKLARRRQIERTNAHKRRVSEYKRQVRINKRERAVWEKANARFYDFFCVDLLTAHGRIANVATAMITTSHSYAPDACMCIALRLLSQGVVGKQHEQQMKLVQNVASAVAKQKLFVDLLAQSSHHASIGVLVHTAKFVSAVEWYYNTNVDLADIAVTNFSSADEALRNPKMDAGEFAGRIDLQAVRFHNIFDPARAYEYARAEYQRRSGGQQLHYAYDPTCPVNFYGIAMRVDPSDVRLATEPYAAIPPLTRYYYIHTVAKYAHACRMLREALHPLEHMDGSSKALVPQLCTLDALGSNNLRLYMGLQNCHLALQLFYEMEPRIRARIKNLVRPATSLPVFVDQFQSRIRSLDFFNGIWSTSADHPPAVLAVISYLDRRIRESNRRPYQYRIQFDSVEVSPFGHYLETLYAGFDVLLGAHTTHRMLALIFTATRHVYSNNPSAFLHPHVLFRGGHGSGKSHCAKTVQDLLIPDTFVNADHTSAQALTFDGDNTNYMVMFQEEASMIISDSGNVSGDGLQVASASTNNTKAMLSDRKVGVLRVMKNALGTLVKQYIMIENNNLFIGTTNAPKHRSNAAILDRLSCVQPIALSDMTRFARPTAADSDALPLDPAAQQETDAARTEFVDFVRLMQALVCKVMFMQGTDGVLLPFVDLSIVASFRVMLCHEDNPFLIVSNARSQRDELNKANRVFKRLNAICEVLTIERALVLAFFCPNSPFTRESEYSDKDLLTIAPLLHTNVEVLYAALGLLYHEFIDEQAVIVLQAITRWMQRTLITSCQEVSEGMWKNYYKVSDFVTVRETEVRDGNDKISTEKLEELQRRQRAAEQQQQVEQQEQQQQQQQTSERIHRNGSIMEWVSAGLRQQDIQRRSKQVLNEFHLRPEDLFDDVQVPTHTEHKHVHVAPPQQQGAGQVAREQMDKSRLQTHADRILFEIVQADKQVLMSDGDIRDAIGRLRSMRLMKSIERSVMSVSFDDAEPCLYVHKDVYHCADPVTTFFDIVDGVLSTRIQEARVVVSTVPVHYQPGMLQRRLLQPKLDSKQPFIPNPQYVHPRHTQRFGLQVVEAKQTLGIKMSSDFDVAALVHCFKSLGLAVDESMSTDVIFRKFVDAAKQINLPVVPMNQLQQTCELFGLDTTRVRTTFSDVYYLQALTHQRYDAIFRACEAQLARSVFADAPLSQRKAEFHQLLSEAMKRELTGLKIDNSNAFAQHVQPAVTHFERALRKAMVMLTDGAARASAPAASTDRAPRVSDDTRGVKRKHAIIARAESLFTDDEDEDEDEDDEDVAWNSRILTPERPRAAATAAGRLAPSRPRFLDAVRDWARDNDLDTSAASGVNSQPLPDATETDLFSSLGDR